MGETLSTSALDGLLGYLHTLRERPSIAALRAKLLEAEIGLEDVAEHLRFSDDDYQRNVILSTPFVDAVVICWRPGQRSVIHDHAKSICGFRVLTGDVTEHIYEPVAPGRLRPARTTRVPKGEVVVSTDADTHVMVNESGSADLVTLHIYSPPLRQCGRYEPLPGTDEVAYAGECRVGDHVEPNAG